MFGRHVKRRLSAYAHGELPDAESRAVATHLAACAGCRAEFEQIRLGIRLAESLTTCSAPDGLWEGIEAALDRQTARATEPPGRTVAETAVRGGRAQFYIAPKFNLSLRLPGLKFALAAASLLIVSGICLTWAYLNLTRGGWEVASLQGTPRIDSTRIDGKGRLAVGGWLETDAQSRAEIKVANIGSVEVDPATRLRLVRTGLTEHRLELARGRLHARIWAPPRLFFVNTPSAVAADLGCAYTLETDDAGQSLLHVTSGWVAFETDTRESIVPAGAACVTRPGVGPGTPFFEDAGPRFVEALSRFDFSHGASGALAVVIDEARGRDTLTLWHLLSRTEGDDRARVYERLTQLSTPPPGVTRGETLALDPTALAQWKYHLEDKWFPQQGTDAGSAWRRLKRMIEMLSAR